MHVASDVKASYHLGLSGQTRVDAIAWYPGYIQPPTLGGVDNDVLDYKLLKGAEDNVEVVVDGSHRVTRLNQAAENIRYHSDDASNRKNTRYEKNRPVRLALVSLKHSVDAARDSEQPLPDPKMSHAAKRPHKTPRRYRSHFDALSDDLLKNIFSSGLRSDDLCRASVVCRRWYRVVWCPALWTSITLHNPNVDADRAVLSITSILSQHTPMVPWTLLTFNFCQFCEFISNIFGV